MTEVTLEVVVGLGANLGERVKTIRRASSELAARVAVGDARLSPVYETAPVGGPPQGDFANAALLFRSRLSPHDLLAECAKIEQNHGRVRTIPWGPRTLDLDVLWICGVVVETPSLQVPHPLLIHRAFALRPLLDLVPGARDPRTGGMLRDELWRTEGQRLIPLEPELQSLRATAAEIV